MSADAWRRCPKCKIQDAKKVVEMYASAKASYGKASPEEYIQNLKSAQDFASESPEETLREDYEISIDEDGEFFCSYRGGCDRCGLAFNFKHECKVPMEVEVTK